MSRKMKLRSDDIGTVSNRNTFLPSRIHPLLESRGFLRRSINITIFIVFIFLSLFLKIEALAAPFGNLKKIVLPDGLTVFLLPDANQPICAVQIWIKSGVINETEDNNGISHFVEHMLFKGTTKYKEGEINSLIEKRGGVINGATGKDFTYYHVTIPSQDWEIAVEVLSSMVTEATFDQLVLEPERLVILEEIKRQNDNPESLLWNNFNKLIFQNTPYRFTGLGTEVSVKKLLQQDLVDYYKKYYVPENMFFVIAGDFAQDTVIAKLNNSFSRTSFNKLPTTALSLSPQGSNQPLESEFSGKVTQIYHLIGFLGPPANSPDEFALDIIAVILGEGRSSRLNKILREEQKLVYGIGASFLTQKGTGIFFVSSQYAPDKINIVKEKILLEIKKLTNGLILRSELEKAKNIIENDYALSCETCAGQANILGICTTLGEEEVAQTYIKRIQKVTVQDIQRVAQRYLNTQNYFSVLLKPE